MSTNIQIRRRGERVVAIRIHATTVHEALSKLTACQFANPRDKALYGISSIRPIQPDGAGWWIVRPA